jgi:hypothetical protein
MALHVTCAAQLPEVPLEQMFAVPSLNQDPDKIDWSKVTELPGETRSVVRGVMGDSGHMHHPAITHFEGMFFAAWNDGYTHENHAGQRVRYAMSRDGLEWSEPIELSGRHPRRGFTTCGFWIRDGEMYALAALRDSRDVGVTGEDPLLLAYRWDSMHKRFGDAQVIARDFFAQNIPQATSDREWMILGKSGVGAWAGLKMAKGGGSAVDAWTIRAMAGTDKLEEPEWYTLPNGHIVAHFRTRGPGRLARSYSSDGGETWSSPVITNFPEASARHHGLRLSNGLYALIVNPNPSTLRIPMSVALSRDGLVYDRIANLRTVGEPPRMGDLSRPPGFNYMRGCEHDGFLYVIYSVNQEDIGVTRVAIAALQGLYR